jgi:O-antigen/teichoic acid export membrane protein
LAPTAQAGGYGRGARILSIAIGTTGLVTFAFFALASHALGPTLYGGVSVLWAVLFVVVSIIYRPIEQLLSRTIAQRRARGQVARHPLRVPAMIQLGFAALFAVVALSERHALVSGVFDGSHALYWILVGGVLAYAASYFARGWLAGNERFALYGGLVLCEALSRFAFAFAVTVGITHGQTAVALGIAAAPAFSLAVVPWALRRQLGRAPSAGDADLIADAASADASAVAADATAHEHAAIAGTDDDHALSLARGGRFALSVLVIMASEQALLNLPVLTVKATADAALAGAAFNILLIARAPLQLFQAIQTSLLPHLTRMHTRDGEQVFQRTVRITLLAIVAFSGAVALGLLAIGPQVMRFVFTGHHYARGGLVLVGLGMGLHLVAGTLNQAALARDRAALAAAAWLTAAVLFVAWLTAPIVSDQLLRVELGYFGATGILSMLLYALYRRPLPSATGEQHRQESVTHRPSRAHAPPRPARPTPPRR